MVLPTKYNFKLNLIILVTSNKSQVLNSTAKFGQVNEILCESNKTILFNDIFFPSVIIKDKKLLKLLITINYTVKKKNVYELIKIHYNTILA